MSIFISTHHMAFITKKKSNTTYKNPESLFRDLRSRNVEGLMSQQADMLREYMKVNDASDIALELPTGSGKTLVGLLIAEWRRTLSKKPTLFVCPTSQLAYQVSEQAKREYGLKVLPFTGRVKDYEPKDKTTFLRGEVIGVTNYSSLFNSNPFFKDLETVVFDDAHAAENYVSGCWSLQVNQGEKDHVALFNALIAAIRDHIPEHDRMNFEDDQNCPLDSQWVNHLPLPKLYDLKANIISIFDEYTKGISLRYSWSLIRENLHACNLFYTNRSFLLRPFLPPLEFFKPFSKTGQRIYMSATLGEGGDLERQFGTYRIKRIPSPSGWEKQGIGRRFFLLPMVKYDEETSKAKAVSWINKFNRALIVTPSDREAQTFKDIVNEKLHYEVFEADQIEKSKHSFVSTNKAVAVLANRYDGIDLNGEDCRYLIISGLPEATNLQERFILSRMSSSPMFHERIRTRITQAVGRCTRSSTDWALVVLIGEKATNYFLNRENVEKLHPELQAEIEFGMSQSEIEDDAEVDANIDLFVSHGEEWAEAESAIIDDRDGREKHVEPSSVVLSKTVDREIMFFNALWTENFESALSYANDIVAELSGDELRGLRAWWYYQAGNAAFSHGKATENDAFVDTARGLYANAYTAAPTISWLRHLPQAQSGSKAVAANADFVYPEILDRIEREFERCGTTNVRKLDREFKAIRDGLLSEDSKSFEDAQVKLGKLFGYISVNSEEDSAPDPWWILTEHNGIVFEDYTATKNEEPRVGKNKIIQAKAHLEWLASEYPDITFQPVLCTTAKNATRDSERFSKELFYMNVSEMRQFAEDGLVMIRKLWDSYNGAGNISWRSSAIEIIKRHNLTPEEVIVRLTAQKFSDLYE